MSKFTLVEMLRSYAEGEEETMGGSTMLEAADRIESLEGNNTRLKDAIMLTFNTYLSEGHLSNELCIKIAGLLSDV